ncbi:unnamed protein product [Calypogeia fissa]
MSGGLLAAEAAQTALAGCGTPVGRLEEPDHSSSNWYFLREEIEKRSPSRLDGIDLKKETYFRKSYCTFLQDLGMCLKVPQVTIATAIVFSHRFYLRQSHLKNDRYMIATICMFLAGKVEETPRPLRDVILMSYEIRHKKDPAAVGRIKNKDVYEEQKELVLVGERLVLTTLGFDLNIAHPYKPLVAAIKRFKVAQNALAQVAWNFVNDGLRTSLCLQFKPHHIAAGAIFLAAKFLKVKLPTDGEKVWWQEFEVTPRQLEEVSNQMLELYEQNKTLGAGILLNGSRPNEPGSSNSTANHVKGSELVPTANGHYWNHNSSMVGGMDKAGKHTHPAKTDDVNVSKIEDVYEPAVHAPSAAYEKKENGHLDGEYEPGHENGSLPVVSEVPLASTWANKPNGQLKAPVKQEVKDPLTAAPIPEDGQIRTKPDTSSTFRKTKVKTEIEDRKSNTNDGPMARDVPDTKPSVDEKVSEDGARIHSDENGESIKVKVENEDEEPRKVWVTSIEDVNTDRLKALAQKRRKSKGEGLDSRPAAVKLEPTDEELLQRELESGVEAAAEERVKQERKEMRSKLTQRPEHDATEIKKERTDEGDSGSKRRRSNKEDNVSEKKRVKSNERVDRADWIEGDTDRGRLGLGLADRTEDGELPSSSHAHDQARSPRHLERRPVPSASHEKTSSPASLKRHREPHGRRDSHRDNRTVHGPRDRDYHQRDHHHQHRADGDRERHYHKERDYQDRDYKKGRAHEVHG